ncbi:MAG: glycosyltransferase, partial [Alphaproteobacteria bacterium]|nr:glycosyltransferase [Alphaproteobacteria bacterium]
MRILFVSHRFPYPPNEGGKIRAYHIIRHLAKRHEVSVASICRNDSELAAARGMAGQCHEFFAARVNEPVQLVRTALRMLGTEPLSMGYFHSRELARWIDAKAREKPFDLAFVHSSSAAQYVEHLQGLPKILDFCDMDSQKWQEYARYRSFPMSLVYGLEGRRLEREERRLGRVFDLSTVATAGELETLRAFGLAERSDWFPNGVDAEYFAPEGTDAEPCLLSFIGRMDYFPNEACMVEFCRTTLPRIRQQHAEARIVIVGANP